MDSDIQWGLIVLVTADDGAEIPLADHLESQDRDVRVASSDDLESALADTLPAGIVLALEDAAAVRSALETVDGRVPTIVAPETGSESLAAAALRGGATEYAPRDGENPPDRIVDALEGELSSPRQRSSRYHRVIATELPDEAFVIAADGTYLEASLRPEASELYTLSAEEMIGSKIADVFPAETTSRLQACIDRALETGDRQSIEYDGETGDGSRRYEARVVPTDECLDGQRAVVWLARDITERARRERALRSRQQELETFNEINDVGREVFETLIDAPDRNAIESAVCENLAESELYCGSWIAERKPDGDLVYRTGEGDATAYLECIETASIEDGFPAAETAQATESRAVTRVRETEPLPAPLQAAAHEDDVGAILSIPIAYEDATYGVLTMLTSRSDAFSEYEQRGFELLCETMGFAIMAVKNRQLLFADSVVELEFRIDGGDSFSFDLTDQFDCTVTLEWTGMTTGGQTYQYVTIEGVDGDRVLETAKSHDSIESCRLVSDGATQCTIEMRLSESGVRTLTNHGVTIRDITVENGVGNCLVEVSQDADIREIAEALAGVYENTELVARRAVDRPVQTAAERRNRILDELTDRQLTTLRLGYYGGFFDWPRESTGEEIADAMDVSPPTMHQHLRKGLKTLLDEFFERNDSASR